MLGRRVATARGAGGKRSRLVSRLEGRQVSAEYLGEKESVGISKWGVPTARGSARQMNNEG